MITGTGIRTRDLYHSRFEHKTFASKSYLAP